MRSMKVTKPDTERNRISDLPDDLLLQIIALLPIKEAVRTCILSTRWKNLITSVSIEDNENNVYEDTGIVDGFMNTEDRVLCVRKGIDMYKFRLKCGNYVDPRWADEGWVQYALRYNVKELEFDSGVPVGRCFEMPLGLICKTLTSLKLRSHDDDGFFGRIREVSLPSLKFLHLENILFSDDDLVKSFFSSCTALEELILHNCDFKYITRLYIFNFTLKRLTISHYPGVFEYHNQILISAPSLVYFKYFHFIANGYLLINLQALVEAYIDFGPVIDSVLYDSATTDLIRGIRDVRFLHLSSPVSKFLLLGHGPIPTMQNMTKLRIGKFYPKGWERLLDFTPCLETLVFEGLPCFQKNIMNPPKELPPCLVSEIKTIKFLSFRESKLEMQMAEYFLKHAHVLENLIIHMTDTKNCGIKITETLLKLPRVSEKCQIVVL